MRAVLRGHKLLTGSRGQAMRDIDSAVDVICRVSEMAAHLGDMIEDADATLLIVPHRVRPQPKLCSS